MLFDWVLDVKYCMRTKVISKINNLRAASEALRRIDGGAFELDPYLVDSSIMQAERMTERDRYDLYLMSVPTDINKVIAKKLADVSDIVIPKKIAAAFKEGDSEEKRAVLIETVADAFISRLALRVLTKLTKHLSKNITYMRKAHNQKLK